MAKRRKRRSPGTGTAQRESNGTYKASFPKLNGGYYVRRGFDTRQAAEAWLDSLVAQRAAKINIGIGQQTVGDRIDAWAARESHERAWKAKTVADVAWKLGYVKPYLGDRAIADILPDDVDRMLAELAADLSPTTIRQIRNYLHQVFEDARQRRHVTFNPVLKPLRRKHPAQKPPQRLSAPQAAVLLRASAESFYGLAWWLICCCGFRAGEICGLRRSDLDLSAATLTVAQEATDVRGKVVFDTPKNDKVRTVPIPRGLVEPLKSHLAALTRHAAKRLPAGTWQEHQLVFPGRGGRPMNPTSLRHNLKRLTDAVKLPAVTVHMLRHTAGQLLTDAGAEEHITAAILGHAPSTITRHYAPASIATMRPYVEAVYGRILGEVRKLAQTGT